MAEENPKSPGKKPIDIRTLLRQDRLPTVTSQGTFYIRHITLGDIKVFNGVFNEDKSKTDLKVLGDFALKTLVSADKDAELTSALTDEIYTKFSDEDVQHLIEGVVKKCNLPAIDGVPTLSDLGERIFDELAETINSTHKLTEQLKKSWGNSFGSLSQGTINSLVDSVKNLNLARDSLKMSPVLEAFKKLQEDQKHLFGGLSNIDHLAQVDDVKFSVPNKPLELPNLGESPIVRAAIASEDSANQLRDVAGLVGNMADKLAKLHTVFLTEVIPQWVDSLETNSKAMSKTLQQTEKSLWWAKWALITSVLVTLSITGWQMWVEHEYNLENDKHQLMSVSILQEQLETSRELNKQLELNAKQLNEELIKVQQSVKALDAKIASKTKDQQASN